MPTVSVIALFKSKPDQVAALKEFLTRLIVPTRNEKGCLRYELHQNPADPTDFAFIEDWESHAAIDAHMKTPHIQEALPHVGHFLSSPPDIRRYVKC